MRLVTHKKYVKRNAQIGNYALGGGLIALVGAFALNLYAIGRPTEVQWIVYVFGAFIIGFALVNVGTYFQNRWGRRPDLKLAEALKTLDDKHTLYNYRLGATHVLVGPTGVWVIVPKFQQGTINYQDDQWRQANAASRGFFGGFFMADPLGKPSVEAADEVALLNKFLQTHVPEVQIEAKGLVVFMHLHAEVSAKGAPVEVVHIKQFKDFIRRQPKKSDRVSAILQALEEKKQWAMVSTSG